MKVAHITEDMTRAILPAVVEMIKADAAKAGVALPMPDHSTVEDYSRYEKSLSAVTLDWMICVGEFGYRLNERNMRFYRGA